MMYIIIDKDKIIKGPARQDYCEAKKQAGQEVKEISTWPKDADGNPLIKKLCRWDGSKVVKKTAVMLEAEATAASRAAKLEKATYKLAEIIESATSLADLKARVADAITNG